MFSVSFKRALTERPLGAQTPELQSFAAVLLVIWFVLNIPQTSLTNGYSP